MKKTRKHQDYIYEAENYCKHPKETFIFLANLISPLPFSKNFNPSILDIGCATGAFLYYVKKEFQLTDCYGVDYSSNLINQANRLDGINFLTDSAESFNIDKEFDVITMQGVLSYFDDIYPSLLNIKKHLKPRGRVYILGFFNDYDVDVQIKYRNNRYFDSFENGWNHHSIYTIKKVLSDIGLKLDNIHEFNLSFELEKQEDPCRSWHINTESGRFFINGLGLMYKLRVLEISYTD